LRSIQNSIKKLDAIDDDRLIAINDGVEHFAKYMEEYAFKDLDAVASAIPFIIFPEEKDFWKFQSASHLQESSSSLCF